MAGIRMPAILADNMVLQQQSSVKIWGKASPEKEVRVRPGWTEEVYVARADAKGDWIVMVKTPQAGGPYEISVSDGEELVLRNVLIGEVWYCSGQSNMEMPVRGFVRQPVEGSTDVINKAKSRTPIRMFTVEAAYHVKSQPDCRGQWRVNEPEAVASTSATAYFFASYLQEVLEVPVGIIVSAWGGSKVEAWMSREALQAFEKEVSLKHLTDPKAEYVPSQSGCVIRHGMVDPLTRYTVRGMLWYQGEDNHTNPDLYRRLMPAFVADMRKAFGKEEMPFYYVQIAPFQYEGVDQTLAARLREVQLQNMKDIPNSGMVVTMDLAVPKEIIHPQKKREVGERLAYWALAKTYGRPVASYCGPLYKEMEIHDKKVLLRFEHEDNGLYPEHVQIEGFEIAGEDRIFYPARAEIDWRQDGRLVVSSYWVPRPVAVRYAYRNYIQGTLFNGAGLPASPFRTDDWE